MKAIIFEIGKSPTQSGIAQKNAFILRFITDEKIWFKYDAASWSGSSSTIKQKEMQFSSKVLAVEFCKKNNIEFAEIEQGKKKIPLKSYTDTIINS